MYGAEPTRVAYPLPLLSARKPTYEKKETQRFEIQPNVHRPASTHCPAPRAAPLPSFAKPPLPKSEPLLRLAAGIDSLWC